MPATVKDRVFATAPFTYPMPIDVVDTIRPFSSVERSAEFRPSHVLPESVESVDDAFANDCNALQAFLSASAVEEAAVTVIEFPLAKFVPLIVPRDPEISPEPIVVVDTSFPFSSVESRAEARKEKYCDPVDVAFTASVEEAMRRVPFSHSAVVVL